MAHAELAAQKSKDRTQVGAALIAPPNWNILSCYNGPPVGVKDLPERRERPIKYDFASHAEQNLIAAAARHGIKTLDMSVYVTHMPCCSCTKSMIQAGIKLIVFGSGSFQALEAEAPSVIEMCQEAGVQLRRYEGN